MARQEASCEMWMGGVLGELARPRCRRIIILLCALWMLNLFDLQLTVLAHEQGMLTEINPLAARLLPYGRLPITLFKMGSLLLGSALIFRFRRRRIAEIAVWFASAIYVLVAIQWHGCYEAYAISLQYGVTDRYAAYSLGVM